MRIPRSGSPRLLVLCRQLAAAQDLAAEREVGPLAGS